MRTRLTALAIAVLLLPACSSGSGGDAAGDPTTTTAVGEALLRATATGGESPASSPTTPTTTSAPSATPAGRPAGAAPREPPNQRTTTHDNGFRLRFVVGGPLYYRADEDIEFELTVENVSNRALQYDPNDERTFVITRFDGDARDSRSWRNTDCQPPRGAGETVRGGAVTLDPGDEVTFFGRYPARAGTPAEDGRRCRLPPGEFYAAFGVVMWCPPGTLARDGACDPARNRAVSSAGIPIRIG